MTFLDLIRAARMAHDKSTEREVRNILSTALGDVPSRVDCSFEPGDVVQLKSGGPPMIIDDANTCGVVGDDRPELRPVLWFNAKGNMRNGLVPISLLMPYEPTPI